MGSISHVDGERYWDPEHPVLTILRRRRETGSKPGHRDDSAWVALAIAGGGMRGAVSAAMCTQLDDGGFRDAFDVVYGCSSGAINAAYFVAQAPETCWYPLSIYYDDLAANRFVDYMRFLRGGSIMDLDYVFDEVLESAKPLDYEAAVNSPLSLVVPVTDRDALKTATKRQFGDAEELKETLRASTRLPLAVNDCDHPDLRFLDGALLTPLPYRLALDDGCTHILSLSTHRIGKALRPTTIANRAYSVYLERIRRGLGSAYLDALRRRQFDREWLTRRRLTPRAKGPYVLDIAPLPWMKEINMADCKSPAIFDRIRDAYAVSHCATEGVGSDLLYNGTIRAMPKMTIHAGLNQWLTAPRDSSRSQVSGESIAAAESAI